METPENWQPVTFIPCDFDKPCRCEDYVLFSVCFCHSKLTQFPSLYQFHSVYLVFVNYLISSLVLLSPLFCLISVLGGCIILFPEFSLPFGFIGLKSLFADLLRLRALYTATRAVTVVILYCSTSDSHNRLWTHRAAVKRLKRVIAVN